MGKVPWKYFYEEVFGLPNIKSAKKRVLVINTKTAQNRAAKSALKTDLKKFDAAVAEGNKELAASMLPGVISAVDKAAAKGIMHKNAANRKKAELSKAAM